MAGTARLRIGRELMAKLYPAFSRRATQVCILSAALEKIAAGSEDPQRLARAALDAADAFDWKARSGVLPPAAKG